MTSPRGVPHLRPWFSQACNEPQTARHFTSSELSRYPLCAGTECAAPAGQRPPVAIGANRRPHGHQR